MSTTRAPSGCDDDDDAGGGSSAQPVGLATVRVLFDGGEGDGGDRDGGGRSAAPRKADKCYDDYEGGESVARHLSRAIGVLFAAVIVGFVLYECAKLNTCYIQERDLLERDYDAVHEAVCTDASKVERFAHRFRDGCTGAMQHYKEGLVHGMYMCFVSKHVAYTVLSFDNLYANVAVGLFVFTAMWMFTKHVTDVAVARHHAAVLDRNSRSLMENMKLYQRLQSTGGGGATHRAATLAQ